MPDPAESVGFTERGARRVAHAARREERFDRLRYNGSGRARFAALPKQRVGWPVRITGEPSSGDPDLYPGVVLEFAGYDGGEPVWADGEACWVVLTPGGAGPLAEDSEHLAAPVGVKDDDEVLIFAVAAAGHGGLTTANTDGTEESTTARLEFDKATGVRVDEDGSDPDVVSLIAASPTQMGAITTTAQSFEGEKRFLGRLYRTESTSGATPHPYCIVDVLPTSPGTNPQAILGAYSTAGTYVYSDANDGGTSGTSRHFVTAAAGGYGRVLTHTNTSGPGSSALTEWTVGRTVSGLAAGVVVGCNSTGTTQGIAFAGSIGSFGEDIYIDTSEWSGGAGPIRHKRTSYIADGEAWGVTRSGTDLDGLDDQLSACYTGEFRGGVLIGKGTITTGTPVSTDYITYCSGGNARRCTLADLKVLLDSITVPPPPPPPPPPPGPPVSPPVPPPP